MSFLARLRPELVCVDPPWRTLADTVEGLVGALVARRALSRRTRDDAVRAVLAREEESSTALLDIAVGVPHARLPGLRRAVVTLAVSPHGLYEPVPTVPLRIVALVLSPPTAAADHLRLVAEISTLLRSPALRDAIVAAPDAASVVAALRAHDGARR